MLTVLDVSTVQSALGSLSTGPRDVTGTPCGNVCTVAPGSIMSVGDQDGR